MQWLSKLGILCEIVVHRVICSGIVVWELATLDYIS